jgi:hypothetical protein
MGAARDPEWNARTVGMVMGGEGVTVDRALVCYPAVASLEIDRSGWRTASAGSAPDLERASANGTGAATARRAAC